MVSEHFTRIACYTAGLIFNYWHKRFQGDSWPVLPEIVNVYEDQECRRIEAAFDFQTGRWAKTSVFVVSRHCDEFALSTYESEIASWDQRLRLEMSRPYPSGVRFNSLELIWQLVHAEIDFFYPDSELIATQEYSIGELRTAFLRQEIHGIIPIGGDDYPDAIKLVEGLRTQHGDYYE